MANLRDLANKLSALADTEAKAAGNRRSILVATVMLEQLVYTTPVDTSKAESNWQVSIGTPAAGGALPPFYPGVKGSTAEASAQAAIDAGMAVLKTKQPGETIYISNVTPYIKALNGGSSRQAAPGFIERAILVGRNAGKV